MFSVTSYSLSHSAPATGAPRAVLALVMENHGIALDRRGFNGIQKRYPKINGMEQTNAISSQRIGNHFQNHLCFNLHACLISPCRLCWSWIFGILRGLRMLLVIFGCNTVLIQSNINWLWLIYSWTNFLGPTWTAAPPRIILTYMAYCGHAIGWALGDMFIFVNFNKHDLWDHDSETPTSQPAEAMMLWSTVLTRNPWETILVRHPRAKCIMCLSKYCIYRMATFMHCHCKWYNMITFHICWWYWLSDHCLSQRHASLVRAGGWWWRLPWKPRALRWTSYQFISMKSQSFLDASTGSITFFFFPFWPFGGDAVEPAANFVGILGAHPASEGLNATSDQSEIPVCVDLIVYWMIWAHCTSQHDVFLWFILWARTFLKISAPQKTLKCGRRKSNVPKVNRPWFSWLHGFIVCCAGCMHIAIARHMPLLCG